MLSHAGTIKAERCDEDLDIQDKLLMLEKKYKIELRDNSPVNPIYLYSIRMAKPTNRKGHELLNIGALHYMAYNRPNNDTTKNYMEKCEKTHAKVKTKDSKGSIKGQFDPSKKVIVQDPKSKRWNHHAIIVNQGSECTQYFL